MKRTIFTAGLGALAMYLFDPQLGRTRRAKLQQQLGGLTRKAAREAERKSEYARGQAEGLRHRGTPESIPENDATLTAKVESEVLSRWSYPKGRISVNSADGVVELRGTCDTPDQVSQLEKEVLSVTGVREVRNHLHLPATPAPNKQDALQS